MEKKTIGGFIAALRKAHGMTQRELAERLNVSDKTVSRWERDDGAPDLSAIPAIAEIFGVTCDELLRGERRSPADRAAASEEGTAKGERERRRLLKSALARYRDRTYIAMGLSLVGLIAALIGNLAFLRAVLGFLLGAVFFVAGLVCQAVFVNGAFHSVEDSETGPGELARFREEVLRLARRSVGLTVACVGFTFPLVLVDAYMGLGADSMLLFGAIGAAAFLTVYGVACWLVREGMLRRGMTAPVEEDARCRHNHGLQKKCFLRLALVMALTMLFHVFGSEMLWSPSDLVRGTVFEDYDSFVAYMAQEIPRSNSSYAEMTPAPETPSDTVIWYDRDGNVVTEEEARTRTLEDADGNVVCTYVQWNDEATVIRTTPGKGTALPVTVTTSAQWRAAFDLSNLITGAVGLLYPVEVGAALLVYLKKRMK